MENRSLDFDADKPAQYKHLRKKMAKIYAEEDKALFEPVSLEISINSTLLIENIEELSEGKRAQIGASNMIPIVKNNLHFSPYCHIAPYYDLRNGNGPAGLT